MSSAVCGICLRREPRICYKDESSSKVANIKRQGHGACVCGMSMCVLVQCVWIVWADSNSPICESRLFPPWVRT